MNFISNKPSKHPKHYSWTGYSYVEKVENSTEELCNDMLIKKDNCISAIKSCCDNGDLGMLYKTISNTKIPKPLDLQIRKKINECMQSKTNDSGIYSENSENNLSELVKLLHAHCEKSDKSFAEVISSCFDLANKKMVSNKFKSQLGL